MSSIAFHSATDTARVSGSERAHFGLFGTDFARRLLDCTLGVRDEEFHARLSTMVPPNHWWHREGGVRRDQAHGLITLHDNDTRLTLPDGRTTTPWLLGINTALAIGNDAVKLGAALHAQCEVHCYVESWDRDWLADLIANWRRCGYFRAGCGWESVIDLLRASNDGPVVTSYSVCEHFPNRALIEGSGLSLPAMAARDRWWDISKADYWDLGIRALRHLYDQGDNRRLQPSTFPTWTFGDGVTAMDLAEAITRWTP